MREIYAHDWSRLGSERIPRWPSKIGEKRSIDVEISSWTQCASTGAKHWYVEVMEQDNAWWSEDDNAWVILSCDTEKAGYSLKAAVLSQEEAVALAIRFVAIIAGKDRKKHCVTWAGPGRPRWGH